MASTRLVNCLNSRSFHVANDESGYINAAEIVRVTSGRRHSLEGHAPWLLTSSASWLNMLERFFCSISTDRLERVVFRSTPELVAVTKEYVTVHNKNLEPFIWAVKANGILKNVIRANRKLGSKINEGLH